MNLLKKSISIFLAADGIELLQVAGIAFPEGSPLIAEVVESDDIGLWIRIDRGGAAHDFLVRWDFIVALDKRADAGPMVGLQGGKDLG